MAPSTVTETSVSVLCTARRSTICFGMKFIRGPVSSSTRLGTFSGWLFERAVFDGDGLEASCTDEACGSVELSLPSATVEWVSLALFSDSHEIAYNISAGTLNRLFLLNTCRIDVKDSGS